MYDWYCHLYEWVTPVLPAFEFISLCLTGPLLCGCAFVFWAWGRGGFENLRAEEKTSEGYLIEGVATSFFSKAADSAFWFIPWAALFWGWDVAAKIFMVGCIPNILFRQGLGFRAAYCHVKASAIKKDDYRIVHRLWACSILSCIAIAAILYFVKGFQ